MYLYLICNYNLPNTTIVNLSKSTLDFSVTSRLGLEYNSIFSFIFTFFFKKLKENLVVDNSSVLFKLCVIFFFTNLIHMLLQSIHEMYLFHKKMIEILVLQMLQVSLNSLFKSVRWGRSNALFSVLNCKKSIQSFIDFAFHSLITHCWSVI